MVKYKYTLVTPDGNECYARWLSHSDGKEQYVEELFGSAGLPEQYEVNVTEAAS